MLAPSRSGRCRGKNYFHVGDPYLSEEIELCTADKMYTNEAQDSTSHPTIIKKDEDLPRGRRKNGSSTSTH